MKVSGRAIKHGGPVGCRRRESPARLGDTLREIMTDKIEPQQGRFESVARVWAQLLPAALSEHCRIVDISGRRLKVLVDSPSYMCELQLCSAAVLKELQRQCPQAQLQKIEVALG
jgi:hypothetical protein